MTNPDLVKLADELDSFAHDMREDANDATALWLEQRIAILRRLASSDGGVKVRELEWSGDGIAQCVFGFYDVSGMGNGTYRVTKPNCYLMPTIFPDVDAARAAAQADYEARIRSALVKVPADAGMREALEPFAKEADNWADSVSDDHRSLCTEPGSTTAHPGSETAFTVGDLRRAKAALTASGATTKSDGGDLPANLAEIIETELTAWRGVNGGVFTIHAAALGISCAIRSAVFRANNTESDGGHGGQPYASTDAVEGASAPNATSGKQEGRTGIEVGASQTPGSSMSSGQSAPILAGQASGPSDPSSTRSDVTALADIAKERLRHREVEGWSSAHDDSHDAGEMASAAACYALSATGLRGDDGAMLRFWPWDDHWWKPTNRRRDLIKAGALIVAEIERLDRLDRRK